jgi:type IV secretory pathway VirB4 component
MSKMTEQYFYNKYYAAAQLPKEREVYSAHLELNNNVKSILLSHIFKSFFKTSANDENRLKILVIEDTMLSLNNLVFENFHEDCEDFIARKNIIIANIDSDNLDSYITKPIENIINNCNTKILLPGEKLPGTFADLLNISLEQLLILNRIPEGSGFFFLQQDDLVTILGLNLYDFTALIAILSSNEDSIAMFQELKKQGVEMDNIIANLYQHFNVTL